MEAQLHLIPASELPAAEPAARDEHEAEPRRVDWRLDPSTKAAGLRGVQAARAALRSAVRQRHLDADDRPASAA